MAKRELSLVEEARVTDAIGEAHAKYSRFHDLYDALTWRLCRDPAPNEAEEIAPETFFVKSEEWPHPGFCIINLVYTVADGSEVVTIEDLWVDDIEQTETADS